MSIFLAGMSEVDITPKMDGLQLSGYAPRNSTGVHDPIKAYAAVFDDRRRKSAICVVDVVGLNKALVESAKIRAADKTAMTPDRIIIASTHTHSAPGLNTDNPLNQAWAVELEDNLVKAIIAADIDRRPAKIGIGGGEISGIGRNRRDPENGPADNEFKVVKIDDTDGNPIGMIVNYACHATTLGLENQLITADYPGAVRDYVQNGLSEKVPVMFLNGACGDVNPGGYSAEASAMGKLFSHRNFGQMEKYGEILGKAVLEISGKIVTEGPLDVQNGKIDVDMPAKQLPLPAVAEEAAKIAAEKFEKVKASNPSDEEFRAAWLENFYASSDADHAKQIFLNYPGGIIKNPVQGVAVGNMLFLALPGEIFTEIGLEIKEASPFEHTLIIGYANVKGGYFPTVKDLCGGEGYEVKEALIGPVAIERMTGWSKVLANRIKEELDAFRNAPPAPPAVQVDPMLNLPETRPQRAKFPAIDIHLHYYSRWCSLDTAAEEMDKLNVSYGVSQVGDCFPGADLQPVLDVFDGVPERIILFTGLDFRKIDDPGWAQYVREKLKKDQDIGAKGIKIYKEVGLRYRDRNGGLIPPEDPRLKPIWDAAADLGMLVLYHIADPINAFGDNVPSNEHYENWKVNTKWWWGQPGFPTHEELVQSMFKLAERNPATTFIFPHCASLTHDLARASEFIQKYENVYVDVSARLTRLGRQPRAARKFFLSAPEKILWGSDILWPNRYGNYLEWFRLLETEDDYYSGFEYGPSKWRLYGLGLPDDVLEKVYGANTAKLLNLEL